MPLQVVLCLLSLRHVRISGGTTYLSYLQFHTCHLVLQVWSMYQLILECVCLQKFVRFLRLWCLCLYVQKRRTNVFSAAVIKLIFCRVMVLFGKELISGHKPWNSVIRCWTTGLLASPKPIGPVGLPDAYKSAIGVDRPASAATSPLSSAEVPTWDLSAFQRPTRSLGFLVADMMLYLQFLYNIDL
jgi:hypothetical protein